MLAAQMNVVLMEVVYQRKDIFWIQGQQKLLVYQK